MIQVLPSSAKQLICAFRGNLFSLGQYHPTFFVRVGILGDLLLLVDLFVIANVAIAPLAMSFTGSWSSYPVTSAWFVSFDLAGFLSSAELFLLPTFMSSAELFLLPVLDIPCFIEPFGFADVFVDNAAIVLILTISRVAVLY